MSATLRLNDSAVDRPGYTTIPPLVDGERLTRDEFERRYQAMPELKKAELIEGVVYVPSPVFIDTHSEPHFSLIGWLSVYQVNTPGVTGGDNGTVDLDARNMPQPDAFLRIRDDCGGQSRISVKRYLNGVPELVAEVSSSSTRYDLGVKLRMYEKAGVQEYLVWRAEERAFDWFERQGDSLVRLEPIDGLHRSKALPGLWLDVDALIRGKVRRVHRRLWEGLNSEEHAEFVRRLGFSTDDDDV